MIAAPPQIVPYRINPDEIRRAWNAIIAPGQVVEVRCLEARVGGEWRNGTYSGYYDSDHVEAVIRDLGQIQAAAACYFTPNPCKPALLARSYNRARMIYGKQPTTCDHDILERRWLLIDVDAVRPAGISATDAERSAAMSLVFDIDHWLQERCPNIAPGIIADSANGAHLIVPICQPTNSTFCETMLKVLAKEFDNDEATVDTSVHNAARIWKLPGTLVCKGDHVPDMGRVWRMSRLVSVMEEQGI